MSFLRESASAAFYVLWLHVWVLRFPVPRHQHLRIMKYTWFWVCTKMHLWFTLHFNDGNGNRNLNSLFWIAPWARSFIKELIFPFPAIKIWVLWNTRDCLYLHMTWIHFSIIKYKYYCIESNYILEEVMEAHNCYCYINYQDRA